MITLITGAPGAAKTLYTVDKIIRPMIGSVVFEDQDPDDANAEWAADDRPPPIAHPRQVFTNIKRFLLDHTLIDNVWLSSVHEHTVPGALVVFDEVQRIWPNRPAGSKKPDAVEFLETHRHEGMDFVLITQNPQLLDPAVRALVGRHLHVRKVASLPLAIIYEWDACSSSLQFRSAFTKTPYRYSTSAYKLYKSARLHTSSKRSIPFVTWVFLGALIAGGFMVPKVYDRVQQATGGKAPASLVEQKPSIGPIQTAQAQPSRVAIQPPKPSASFLPDLVRAAPRSGRAQEVSSVVAGCMVVRDACQCFDAHGVTVAGDPEQCSMLGGEDNPLALGITPPEQVGGIPSSGGVADLHLIAWARERSH